MIKQRDPREPSPITLQDAPGARRLCLYELPFSRSENVNMQFRAQAFNLFNRVQFGYPGLQQGASNFGIVSSQLNNPRFLQFSLRLNY